MTYTCTLCPKILFNYVLSRS